MRREERMDMESITSEADALDDVPSEHYPKMLSQMRNDFPQAIHAHEYVRTLLKLKKLKPNLDLKILAPGGDYRLGIIFFTVRETEFVGSVYCYNEEARKVLQNALVETKKIPKSKGVSLFTCMPSRSYEAAKPFFEKGKWTVSEDLVFWLPWYSARQIVVHVPDGLEIRKLSPEHADQINEVWPHKYPGSRNMLVEQIEVNFGLGLFRGDELLSWAIHFFYGGIGAVQTVETEKRKGYGRAVVEAITKKLGETQNDVHLNVVSGNKSAEAFFRSLGFRFAYTSYWTFSYTAS